MSENYLTIKELLLFFQEYLIKEQKEFNYKLEFPYHHMVDSARGESWDQEYSFEEKKVVRDKLKAIKIKLDSIDYRLKIISIDGN